jgi:hypothetical protein
MLATAPNTVKSQKLASLEKFKIAAKASLESGPGEVTLSAEEIELEPLLRANPDRYVSSTFRILCVGSRGLGNVPSSATNPMLFVSRSSAPRFLFFFSFLCAVMSFMSSPTEILTWLYPSRRFVVLPIQYPEVWAMYKKAMGEWRGHTVPPLQTTLMSLVDQLSPASHFLFSILYV